MLGNIDGRRRKGRQSPRWLDDITNSMKISLSKLRRWWRTGKPGAHGVTKSPASAGDTDLIPGLSRSPGRGKGNPLYYPFLEKSHGQRSLAAYSPCDRKESDTTERANTHTHTHTQNNTDQPYKRIKSCHLWQYRKTLKTVRYLK